MFYSRSLFRFIRVSRCKELDPVLDAVFGKDEHDTVELLLGAFLSLRFLPELVLERIAMLTIVITVGPYHRGLDE